MTKYISKQPNPQGVLDWTADENKTWNTLIERQTKIVQTRACAEFLEGLDRIQFSKKHVPQHSEINQRLKNFTGWEVEIVPALIPAKEFFTLLANKKFPAASFIRIPEELDYIQEPDIFHEFYGHVPLLTFKEYANFMEDFGKLALSASPSSSDFLTPKTESVPMAEVCCLQSMKLFILLKVRSLSVFPLIP